MNERSASVPATPNYLVIWSMVTRVVDEMRPQFRDGLAVTQFVSCLFFGAGFATALVRRDGATHVVYSPARDGFGALGPDVFALVDAGFLRTFVAALLMVVFVALNAWRYYLSFWFVEESDAFRQLRAKMPRPWGRFEWALRFVSLISLYLVQASFAHDGLYSDYLITFVFFVLWRWDRTIYAAVTKEDVKCEIKATDLDEFTRSVLYWKRLEGSGFAISTSYVLFIHVPVWLHLEQLSVQVLLMLVGALSIVFIGIFAVDLWINWKNYKRLVVPVVVGTVIAAELTLFFASGTLTW